MARWRDESGVPSLAQLHPARGRPYASCVQHRDRQWSIGSGYRSTFVALVEFGMSRRTDAYGTVDFDKISGARRVEAPRSKAQTGVALGPCTIFEPHGSGVNSSAVQCSAVQCAATRLPRSQKKVPRTAPFCTTGSFG
jgi:hypothetical protein